MARIEIYREWYEQEKFANAQMLGMLQSIPSELRTDPRFQRASILVAHLAACRENWLDRMASEGTGQTNWWPEEAHIDLLPSRYSKLEARWTEYLDGLDDTGLDEDFEFPTSNSGRFRWNIEGQIRQLVGHAFYHRGQVALLVDELGGETVDSDYLYWAVEHNPDRWRRL